MATSEMNYMDITTGEIEVGVERLVGTFKIGGVVYNRYVKVVDCGEIPSSSTKTVAHGITNIVGVLSLKGIMKFVNTPTSISYYVLPYVDKDNLNDVVRIHANTTHIYITTGAGWGSSYTALVTIEYYK